MALDGREPVDRATTAGPGHVLAVEVDTTE
jgi:hypothetical protein